MNKDDAEILAAVTGAVKVQVLATLGEYFEAHQQEPEPHEHGARLPDLQKDDHSTAQQVIEQRPPHEHGDGSVRTVLDRSRGRPTCFPLDRARSIPVLVRSTISSRSNSAKAAGPARSFNR